MNLRVKEICKEKGVLMVDLASQLGIARVNLTKAINGNPTIETLEKIATALNVPVVELFQRPASGNITCPSCGSQIKLSVETVVQL
jgi:transcriptional regulator with XRE-family HTH domain